MKILIQEANGAYWAGQNCWTQQPEAAFHFSSSIAALNFITVNRLSAVRLVFKFDDPSYDIPIAFGEFGGGSKPSFSQVGLRVK